MLRLSFIILFSISVYAQSPHGEQFNFDCGECHTTSGWKVTPSEISFNHNAVKFALTGQHQSLDCNQCHSTLKFSEAHDECLSCHKDIHQNTVGSDCARCHNTNSWLITNINELHQNERFPLAGKHSAARCEDCHKEFTDLRFTVINTRCFDCHSNDYYSAKVPDHVQAGFSTECSECHNIADYAWKAENINHDFFPLAGRHNIANCFECHKGNTFKGLSKQCYSCHSSDFVNTVNPDHEQAGFSTECQSCHNINGWSPAAFSHTETQFPLTGAHTNVPCSNCHSGGYNNVSTLCYSCHKADYDETTNPNHTAASFPTTCESCHTTSAWEPAEFDHDGQYFPIYSGKHNGKWDQCSECHTVQNNFALFSCIDCHEHNKPETDNDHTGVQGYVYSSQDCFACHPTGTGEGSVNHSLTDFPLTGAHLAVNCADCHQDSYSGTPVNCVDCHNQDFQNTTNPSHQSLSLSTECSSCHSTSPGWKPASFTIHNNYYELLGAHSSIANDCAGCHNNNYTSTPNTCHGCHESDFNAATNPSHTAAGFSTDCLPCHSQTTWKPATFDHDGQYFLIYSGKHNGKWDQCAECHTVQNNFALFSCIDCHEHNKPETDNDHTGVQGYVYSSQDCFACHPTGTGEGGVNHSLTDFPLTGAHLAVNCADCHQNGYSGTPVNCVDCHTQDYQQTVNPSHRTLNLSTECSTCHNTTPGWKPASFPDHKNYYELTGAHASIADDCASCHKGNYAAASKTCYECHQNDFNNAANPNHLNAGISTKCEECHSPAAWNITTFQHISTGFDLTGAHKPIQCSSCHKGTTGGLTGTCIECHQVKYDSAPDHKAQNYPQDCEMCHNTTIWTQTEFSHANTNFPLTGAHVNTNCSDCHQGGYTGTPINCADCHNEDYLGTVNPSHQALLLSTECSTCHTTAPGWKPASFSIHNNFYELAGAHAVISNDCADCHNGNYISTPNTCNGCHAADFNNTTNPNHSAAGFPTDCVSCHSQTAWEPATFDHDGQYFPIYSGKHREKWNLCSECHTVQNNFAVFSCIDCHEHNKTETDDDHRDVPNYAYLSTACFDCHPTGQEDRLKGLVR